MGIAYEKSNKISKAEEFFKQALQNIKLTRDIEQECQIFILLGSLSESSKRNSDAKNYYQKGFNLSKSKNKSSCFVQAIQLLIPLSLEEKNYLRVVELAKNLKLISKKDKLSSELIVALNYLGTAYVSLAEYDKAISVAMEGLKLAKAINDLDRQAFSLSILSKVYSVRGKTHRSIEYSQERLSIYKKLKNEQGIFIGLISLSGHYTVNSNYKKSIDMANQALELAKKNNESKSVAIALKALMNAYIGLRNFEEALHISKLRYQAANKTKDKCPLLLNEALNDIQKVEKLLKDN